MSPAARLRAAIALAVCCLLIAGCSQSPGASHRDSAIVEPPKDTNQQPLPSNDTSTNPLLVITPIYYQDGDWLGKYYIDINGPTTGPITSAEESRLAQEWEPQKVKYAQGDFAFAGTVSINGLRDYSRYLSTGDKRFLEDATAAADWLIEQQTADGKWPYTIDFEGMKPPWISGMDQGLAISLLTRIYQQTGEAKYLRAAAKAYTVLDTPVAKGGAVDRFGDGGEVLEEYPGNMQINRHVLNGGIFATLGVLDYARVTGDPLVVKRWKTLSANFINNLRAYDLGVGSAYSDPRAATQTYPAVADYHRLHIAQLRLMARATGDARWQEFADRWYTYLVKTVEDSQKSE